MKKLAFVGSVIGVAAAAKITEHPVSQKMVDAIKAKNPKWQTMDITKNPFAKKTLEQINRMVGPESQPQEQIVFKTKKRDPTVSVPESFDARDQWGAWIHPIRDQGDCNGDYSFAAADMLTDRYTISSKGEIDEVISAQDPISCYSPPNNYCYSGFLTEVLAYMEFNGVESDSCYPFTSADGKVASCDYSCADGSTPKLFHCTWGDIFQWHNDGENAKAELFTNGPIVSYYYPGEDFLNYQSGIYAPTLGESLGVHMAKVIGFGTEDGTDYWTVALPYGEDFGISGFAKLEANSAVQIELNMYSCTPDLSTVQTIQTLTQ